MLLLFPRLPSHLLLLPLYFIALVAFKSLPKRKNGTRVINLDTSLSSLHLLNMCLQEYESGWKSYLFFKLSFN